MSERNPEKKAPEIASPAGKIKVDKGELSEEDLKQVSGGGLGLPTAKPNTFIKIHFPDGRKQ